MDSHDSVEEIRAGLLFRLRSAMEIEPGSELRAATMDSLMCEYFEFRHNAPDEWLPRIDAFFDEIEGLFLAHAEDLAGTCVRKSSPMLLAQAIEAWLLDHERSDFRDRATALALLANSADHLGLQFESLMRTVDARGASAAALAEIATVFRLPKFDRRIERFGFHAVSSGMTFKYERTQRS
jgi:hypothetical protein